MSTPLSIPRIFLSGLSGGSGKTFVSLALSRAWSRKNFNVLPFKKGPDYIDPAWLSLACRNPCYCLDPFFLDDVALKKHFISTFQNYTKNVELSQENISAARHSGLDLFGGIIPPTPSYQQFFINFAYKKLQNLGYPKGAIPFAREFERQRLLKRSAVENEFQEKFLSENMPKKTIALIEGNRGLFDGKDKYGSCSSAHLAKLIDCPVIVSINCRKITRTVAAIVMGLQNFDKNLNLAGVIFNNTASDRHANLVRESVEMYTDIPVIGVLPRMHSNPIPERHMGLHLHKQGSQEKLLDSLADFFEEHMSIETIANIAFSQEQLMFEGNEETEPRVERDALSNSLSKGIIPTQTISPESISTENNPTESVAFKNLEVTDFCEQGIQKSEEHKLNIAYIYDDALWFYYQENFDALKNYGANLIPLSILEETPFEEQIQNYFSKNPVFASTDTKNVKIDALYIGGGFPELYAMDLHESPQLATLKEWVENDLPVYAECGGFMLLSKALHIPKQSLIARSKRKNEKIETVGSNKGGISIKTHSFDEDSGTQITSSQCNEDALCKMVGESHIIEQCAENKEIFNMAHIFEAETEFFSKPQGLGYIIAHTMQKNPYHPLGTIWHGHEFHFSKSKYIIAPSSYILGLEKGYGMQKQNLQQSINKNKRINPHSNLTAGIRQTTSIGVNPDLYFDEKSKTIHDVAVNMSHDANFATSHEIQTQGFQGFDGFLYKQCFASYAHLFAPAVPHWAYHFVQAAHAYKNNKKYIAQ